MKIEVLVTTMNCDDVVSLYKSMNLHSDAVIANQCSKNDRQMITIDDRSLVHVSSDKRGVSRNRNEAIENSSGDILVTADDDLVYFDNYESIILDSYRQFPDCDLILFDIPSNTPDRPTFRLNRSKLVSYSELVRFATFQVTYKKSILQQVRYSELFGPGSTYFKNGCGEDTLFLSDVYRKKYKIAYVDKAIATVTHNQSTWISSQFSDDFFISHGALFTACSNNFLAYFYIIYYAFVKRKDYSHKSSLLKAISLMLQGRTKFIKLSSNTQTR